MSGIITKKKPTTVRSLIVRYNFLKYRAKSLQERIAGLPLRVREMDRFDNLITRISQARGSVIAAVLPLVLSIVRRQMPSEVSGSEISLVAMLHAANTVLFEEIDRFDPAIKHPFESVLTNRLLRALTVPDLISKGIDEASLVVQLREAGFSHE